MNFNELFYLGTDRFVVDSTIVLDSFDIDLDCCYRSHFFVYCYSQPYVDL